ncbi:uncharacterized protein V1518DRAFT_417847 [Limtongia smithiae]|uniref:uncharacterized protein n=1 Tax=Limtongia smithiae TaxID=1125753 RepID=UPI0034CF260F
MSDEAANASRREFIAYIVNFLLSPDEYEALVRKIKGPRLAGATGSGPTLLPAPSSSVGLVKRMIAELIPSTAEMRYQSHESNVFLVSLFRTSSRVYSATYLSLSVVKYVLYLKERAAGKKSTVKPRLADFTRVRYSIPLAVLVSIYRALHPAALALHTGISTPEARKFRHKHKSLARAFHSPYFASSLSAAVSGLALILYPAGKNRSYAAFYSTSLAAEYYFSWLTAKKEFAFMARQAGPWIMLPFSLAQLLYAFTYDKDCVPTGFTTAIKMQTENHIMSKPQYYLTGIPWPSHEEILDSLRSITEERYPPFNSSILYPDSYSLPSTFKIIDPLVSQAHPGIKNLSCAILHPNERSCMDNFSKSFSKEFVWLSKYVGVAYAAAFYDQIKIALSSKRGILELALGFVRANAVATMMSTTIWSGLCVSQFLISNRFIPKNRIKVIGFVAGLWAYLLPTGGGSKAPYISVARMAAESYWKSLVKHGRVFLIPHGDVLVFAASFAVIMALFDQSPASIESSAMKKVYSMISGSTPKEIPPSAPETPIIERKSM